MKFSEIARLRLYNQSISRGAQKPASDLLSRFGAIQGQDYGGAKWSLGLRLGVNEAAIDRAIEEGSIVRTWMMRGTQAFVSGRDIRWLLGLLSQRVIAGAAPRDKRLDLDRPQYEIAFQTMREQMQGGKRLIRSELLSAIHDAGVPMDSHRGYHTLWRAALEGVICFGPMRGNEPTFVLVDEWVPQAQAVSREEALTKLALAYFTSRGPATLQDFAWWSSLTAAEARQGAESAGQHLVKETVEGKTYWMEADGRDRAPSIHGAYLLPGFDEFLLGYRDREASLDGKHAGKWCPGGNGVFRPFFVVDGKVSGTWSKTVKKGAAGITLAPFDGEQRLDLDVFEAPGLRYAGYLGASGVSISTAGNI